VMLGSGFISFLQELNKTQWSKQEKLKKNQERRLRVLVKHAYDKVPYYHRVFKERGIKPSDIKVIDDLKKLPILTKNDARNNFDELIAVDAKDYKYGISHTGGSTGKPLNFLLDQQNREMEYASLWRHRMWANVCLDGKIATFRTSSGWRKFYQNRPCWKFDAFSKQLEFNIFRIDNDVINTYVNQLRKFRPDLIEGYPSVIQLLAMHIVENNLDGVFPRAIQTTSETLSAYQRSIIEKAFRCKVYNWYGQSEYVVAAGECSEGGLHIVESGIMELIRHGEEVGEGEIGEMIGTGLYNYSMPFIRYRLGDVGKFTAEKCGCGRGLKIMKSIQGRVSDIVVTPDGKLFPGITLESIWRFRIRPYTPNVDYVHVIQKSKDRLVIEMVKQKHYSDKETQIILEELRRLLGTEIKIEFEDLNSIPVGRKWRFAESQLNLSLL
jgi:phenylacetate-CoA ligase